MKKLYILGGIILFLGLLWAFLPHATHTTLTQVDEVSHIFHTLEGIAFTLLGLYVMLYSARRKKHYRNRVLSPS